MKRVAVPYKLNKERNFEIDLEHMATLVNEKTSFIYIINPTNPMGTVFSREHMSEILQFSEKYEVPLVVDEVYFKQVYPGVDYLSFGDLTEDVPVVVLSGYISAYSVLKKSYQCLDGCNLGPLSSINITFSIRSKRTWKLLPPSSSIPTPSPSTPSRRSLKKWASSLLRRWESSKTITK